MYNRNYYAQVDDAMMKLWKDFGRRLLHVLDVKVLSEAGYRVITSHIDDGMDYFTYEPDNWTVMVSNPPFSKKDEVLERAYSLGKPFALLLPINAIQGRRRFDIYQNRLQLLCFDQRIGYISPSMICPSEATPFASAYFCNDFLPSKLELRRLYKGKTRK